MSGKLIKDTHTNTEDKPADVSPVGYTASLRRGTQGANAADKLEQEPEAKEIEGRNPNEGDEEEDNGGADSAVGKEEEISTENAGNGTTSADGRDLRHGVCRYLKPDGSDTGCQIEEQVPEVPKPVFYIAPKYP